MEITKAEDYIKTRRKHVELPSGATFRIRKISANDFLDVGETPQFFVSMKEKARTAKSTEELLKKLTPDESAKTFRFMNKVVCSGVVEPTIVESDSTDSSEISINDVDDLDKKALFDEIIRFSGMTEHDKDVIEKFREGNNSSGRGYDSPKIRGTTNTTAGTRYG